MRKGSGSVQVVILCGGMGTRLREETEFRPKPMVEIGGKPILWHIMKIYCHYGFNDFVLCLGYKGNMIKEYFLNYRLMNSDFTLKLGSRREPEVHNTNLLESWSVTFADTGIEAMTGARVKKIEPYITEENFMLTYGDGVANIDLDQLWEFHQAHGKIGTVSGVRPVSRFGELAIEDGVVKEFSEKPQAQDAFISGGFFVFRRSLFDYLKDEDSCILEREPLERLARDGQLMGYAHKGFWHCMDTYRDFLYLNHLWKNGNTPWAVWEKQPR